LSLTFGFAFLAGLASFLSPCVFSLVPAYIGYLGGRTLPGSEGMKASRWVVFYHGIAFVLGFSVIFIGLGLTASFIGVLLFGIRDWLAKIGGAVVILLGLQMTGLIHISFLDRELRPTDRVGENRSLFSSFSLGVFFSAGWSPCVGPVLGSILTLSLNADNINEGAAYLAVYSAGLAIPFLLTALGIGWISEVFKKFRRFVGITQKVLGVFLIVIGLLLFFDLFTIIARFGYFVDFGI
jgi:cytochrome c-type biogenesis protein